MPRMIKKGSRKLFIIFITLVAILIAATFFFSFYQALVVITPLYNQQRISFSVQLVDKNKLETDQNSIERIPGEILEISMEKTRIFEAPGYEENSTKASGQVTIINNYSRNQPLVATTRLLAPDGKLYRLVESVLVEAGQSLITRAEADQPGTGYESGPDKLTIPGLWQPLQDKIYAQSGGFKVQSITKYNLDQASIDLAKMELTDELTLSARQELDKRLKPGQKIIGQSLIIETARYSTDAEVGSANKEFSITLGLVIKAAVFDEDRLKELALANLPEIYKTSNSLVKVNPDSFNYEVILLAENSENSLAQINAEYTVEVSNVKINAFELTGMGREEAESYLNSLSDVKETSITLPFGLKRLPFFESKINIQINK